ncbi:phospho-N-acetylmuramoyl-pentapeptide-transferase [Cryptosporangium aurantiacum]|uniref:Phospho-N-acetylmuramoyl-pentapeptide-transferase n=1 Tax=Cryptosporangium aurantiacum TaxID=134849 RepID=A0A1M7RN56_9ACTN|nr:phospho-N-acetylmuramoyl-pentapeptide-transferase [Cryptosporangium aurantiacum]SHN47649.1 Phospho-N-acetylmuramoyl-pentapeptide-transferase [Cryptosporangium aurantiacum]
MRSVLAAAFVAFVASIFGTPIAIGHLHRLKFGQEIREEGPKRHWSKRGTPTMGGIVFILATVLAYVVIHVVVGGHRVSPTAVTLLGLFVGMGLVGFVDDFIKIRRKRSLGLNKRGKLIGQAVVAAGFAFLALNLPDENGYTIASEKLSFTRDVSWAHLTQVGAALFFAFVVIAAANGVNLTDGLDGLATGPSIMVLSGYILIGLWQYRHICGEVAGPNCYTVRDPLDAAVLAAAAAGALAGFLWWNAPPARLFMGDTGALGIGGLIAGLALTTRTTLLLLILGGLFVIVTMSVVIQIISFRSTGRRVFRMAPLQHHFELVGWQETTIVVRFWIISGVFVAAGLSIFVADYLDTLTL